ncbi:MAG: sodium-translocating pyrophosphatase [Planctomycetota bacterium]
MSLSRLVWALLALVAVLFLFPSLAQASEADLVLPDFSKEKFLGLDGWALLTYAGFTVSILGLLFGLVQYVQVKNLPVHKSMLEVSELIYETCKAYLTTQGKFLMLLWAFIAAIMVGYFGWLVKWHAPGAAHDAPAMHGFPPAKVAVVLAFSLVGMAGSYAVAWFGMRINTFANSRTAFASLKGKPFPTYAIPLQAGMSIGMVLISLELAIMLFILLFVPKIGGPDWAGPCFIGFAIGESLGAAALRIAGGIFTKIADIGSDLMKIVFNIKEDDARNPGVIADCTGDNAGDSVGPSADGFETYGVTGVALITFILLATTTKLGVAAQEKIQTQLLVWIFFMRLVMVIASAVSYFANDFLAKAKYRDSDHMNFEAPLTVLVWLTSIVSMVATYAVSYLLIPDLAGDTTLWWKLSTIISCGTLAGALIPEFIKVFTSTDSGHVREIVTASREGGASLNVLSGLIAGNFSAYWMGIVITALMGVGYWVSLYGVDALFLTATIPGVGGAPATVISPAAVFAFGLVAFGFLGMGPVTIAVDSYGPVTDNAQSVYELSLIETVPNVKDEIKKDFGFEPNFAKAKDYLEENDGAGNTFKATAKPVLIGTAVVGATTMIFSIIMVLTNGLTQNLDKLSLLHAPFLLGMIMGGAVIHWFAGGATQAVSTGAYRAVEFIKKNIRLEGVTKASVEDSRKVVAICTQYAQKGMFNLFLGIFFSTLAFACFDPYFFIGYLISIALFGLMQALFMANAGGAWDNAKKVVEVELKMKGTPLHAACVVGDTVGDPFKDTSSVAMNPVIKFTTLFGLLAVELAIEMSRNTATMLAVVFFVLSMVFVWRSFYGMRIESEVPKASAPAPAAQPAAPAPAPAAQG